MIADGTPVQVQRRSGGRRSLLGDRQPMLLEIAALEAGYGDIAVLRGIELAVDAGELVAVLGANGAGKTDAVARHLRRRRERAERDACGLTGAICGALRAKRSSVSAACTCRRAGGSSPR